jgi:predicted RNA binding protein YcfA (HicA-like mRNA interferase family)
VYIILEKAMPKRYSSKELMRMLTGDGWFIVKISGDHHKFKHPSKKGIVVLPHPAKDIPIGTARQILKQADIEDK